MMESITLLELTRRISALVQRPETQNVWVTAELSDVSVRGGHCYMELLQKDDRGVQVAKARGVIWANVFARIDREFYAATGQRFATGLKVLLCVSASMHSVYGFSLVVNAVDPQYTLGDLMRRRQEILRKLKEEGILDLNHRLQWQVPTQRIAVISAPNAAGYGDFMNQLYHNPLHLRFYTRLYPAVMQGEKAPKSIIAALEQIAADIDTYGWHGVVIIRGGGATSDLQAFEDYDLAANVAQFPLPVAIGIGHERDVTVLDWVANTRLKTPTAVAEWLISNAENQLALVVNLGNKILQLASDRLSGNKEQLAQAEAILPSLAINAIERAQNRLRNAGANLASISAHRILPQLTRLDMSLQQIATASSNQLLRQSTRLDNFQNLLEALSPMATLKRGYSITRVDGHAVTSLNGIEPGTIIETTIADGIIHSQVTNKSK